MREKGKIGLNWYEREKEKEGKCNMKEEIEKDEC